MRLRLLAPLGAKPELERLLAAQGATIEYQDLGLNGQQARGWQLHAGCAGRRQTYIRNSAGQGFLVFRASLRARCASGVMFSIARALASALIAQMAQQHSSPPHLASGARSTLCPHPSRWATHMKAWLAHGMARRGVRARS